MAECCRGPAGPSGSCLILGTQARAGGVARGGAGAFSGLDAYAGSAHPHKEPSPTPLPGAYEGKDPH